MPRQQSESAVTAAALRSGTGESHGRAQASVHACGQTIDSCIDSRTVTRIALFITACALSGLGGALGSVLGNAFGTTGLWAGGVIGGQLAALLIARVAVWRGWIAPTQFGPTALCTAIGFLIAAAIAVNTLSSPVGPVLSTTIPGLGALLGASLGAPPRDGRPG